MLKLPSKLKQLRAAWLPCAKKAFVLSFEVSCVPLRWNYVPLQWKMRATPPWEYERRAGRPIRNGYAIQHCDLVPISDAL